MTNRIFLIRNKFLLHFFIVILSLPSFSTMALKCRSPSFAHAYAKEVALKAEVVFVGRVVKSASKLNPLEVVEVVHSWKGVRINDTLRVYRNISWSRSPDNKVVFIAALRKDSHGNYSVPWCKQTMYFTNDDVNNRYLNALFKKRARNKFP